MHARRYYAEEMYRLWKQDPNSVHPSWSVYFSGMARGLKSEDAFRPPPNLLDLAEMSTEGSAIAPIEQGSDVQDHMKVGFVLPTICHCLHCVASFPSRISSPCSCCHSFFFCADPPGRSRCLKPAWRSRWRSWNCPRVEWEKGSAAWKRGR